MKQHSRKTKAAHWMVDWEHTKTAVSRIAHLYYFEIIHALKAGIAVLIGYACFMIFPHNNLMPQWILITIIVVMSSNSALGTQINKSLFRILATLVGSLLAILAISTPNPSISVPLYLFMATTVFIFIAISYAKYSYVGSLGAITFCMITLSAAPKISLAVERTVEILLGIIISLLVSRFILPIRSVKLIKQLCFLNLTRIATLYQEVLINNKDRFYDNSVMRLEGKILESHAAQRQLQGHIKYENKQNKQNSQNIKLIIRSQTALYRYFSVLEIARRVLKEGEANQPAYHDLLEHFIQQFIVFISYFSADGHPAPEQPILEMKADSQKLLEHTYLLHNQNPIFSTLHTLYFIENRIIFVCQNLIAHIHNTYHYTRTS